MRAKSVVDVGALDEFEDARPRVIQAGGRELGIVRWHEAIYAIRNVCPHMGARLCSGIVTARLVSEGPTSRVETDANNPVIACPWHGWMYEVVTGHSVFDPEHFRVKSYPVSVVEGRVLVELGRP